MDGGKRAEVEGGSVLVYVMAHLAAASCLTVGRIITSHSRWFVFCFSQLAEAACSPILEALIVQLRLCLD